MIWNNATLKKSDRRERAQGAQSLLPLRIGWGEGRGEVHPFPLLIAVLLLLLISPLLSSAATFTNNVTLTETNNTYDGQDIVISGTTVTIDGPHSFNSVLMTTNLAVPYSACAQ